MGGWWSQSHEYKQTDDIKLKILTIQDANKYVETDKNIVIKTFPIFFKSTMMIFCIGQNTLNFQNQFEISDLNRFN